MDVGLQKMRRRRDGESQVRLQVWEKLKHVCTDRRGTKETRALRGGWTTG